LSVFTWGNVAKWHKKRNFRVEIRFTHFRVQALKINFFCAPWD
jgi:hypothetical protein